MNTNTTNHNFLQGNAPCNNRIREFKMQFLLVIQIEKNGGPGIDRGPFY